MYGQRYARLDKLQYLEKHSEALASDLLLEWRNCKAVPKQM